MTDHMITDAELAEWYFCRSEQEEKLIARLRNAERLLRERNEGRFDFPDSVRWRREVCEHFNAVEGRGND